MHGVIGYFAYFPVGTQYKSACRDASAQVQSIQQIPNLNTHSYIRSTFTLTVQYFGNTPVGSLTLAIVNHHVDGEDSACMLGLLFASFLFSICPWC